jgi:hypothetical protein
MMEILFLSSIEGASVEDISIARKESHYLSIEISFACKRGKNSVKSYLSYGDALLTFSRLLAILNRDLGS